MTLEVRCALAGPWATADRLVDQGVRDAAMLLAAVREEHGQSAVDELMRSLRHLIDEKSPEERAARESWKT